MQGEEPTSGLIHAFGDEVCWKIGGPWRVFLVVLPKHEMILGIGHGSGIKPNIHQIRFSIHRLSGGRYQDQLIHLRPVQIMKRIRIGNPGGLSLLNRLTKFLDGPYATPFETVIGTPNRQGCAPITRTGQIPIHQILQPIAKASDSGALRLPLDFTVQGDHPVFDRCGFHEPRIQGIIQNRFVRPPTMGIGVLVFLDAESQAFPLQFESDQFIRAQQFSLIADHGGQAFPLNFQPLGFLVLRQESFLDRVTLQWKFRVMNFGGKATRTIHQG